MTLYDKELLPASVQDAMILFEYRYAGAIDGAEPPGWARELGDFIVTDKPLVRFPIGEMASKYTAYKGDIRTKDLQDRYADIKTSEYQNGYEVEAIDLIQNPVRAQQWARVPAQFVNAEGRFINNQVAALLQGGTSAGNAWDTEFYFDTDHPANPSDSSMGTWSNYQSVAKDPANITNITAEVALMQEVKGPDGELLGINPDTLMLPVQKFEAVSTLLAQNFLASGATNPYFNRFKLMLNPSLGALDANDWYLMDSRFIVASGAYPWGTVQYVPPGPLGQKLGLRWFDENSDYFKNTGRLKVSSHLHYASALLHPHAIRRIAGA